MKPNFMALFVITLYPLAVSPSKAQVFEPVSLRSTEGFNTRNSVLLHASQFHWSRTGLEGDPGFLIAGDFSIGKNFGIGGWYATDSQHIFVSGFGNSSADVQWYNLHLSWYFYQRPRATFGLSTGALGANIKGGGLSFHPSWTEIDFLASFGLDGTSKRPSRLTLGLTLGGLAGTSSSSTADFKTADGFSYGISLGYRVNKLLSVDVASWNMSLNTGSTISRLNAGVGFHF